MTLKSRSDPVLVLLVAVFCIVLADAGSQSARAMQRMVISATAIASEIGARAMQDGGNAVDAAVATAFALAVTHPVAGNIGGGGFMLIRLADGRSVFVDYREVAPAAASRKMYLDARGELKPEASIVGA